MRKLIVANIISLDGYFEGPDKNVMDLFRYGQLYPTDNSFSEYNAARLRTADTLLLGRKSYEGFLSYWPGIEDDPNQPPLEQEISQRNNAIDKLVVSDTLTPDATGVWRDSTRIVKRADAPAAISELKQQGGRDILIFGSRVLWNSLLAQGLVDEFHLMVAPLLVGGGTRAFDGHQQALLRLIGSEHGFGTGTVWMRYEVAKG